MGFKFPLATVLRLKQSIERQEELALQRILLDISRVQHQIEALTSDIAHARQLMDQAMQRMLPAILVQSMTSQIDGAVKRRQELVHALSELRQKVPNTDQKIPDSSQQPPNVEQHAGSATRCVCAGAQSG